MTIDSPARPRFRRVITYAATVLLALGGLLAPVSTAAAVSVDAECLGGFARTFSPPVTLTPQALAVASTFDYNTCVVGPTATGTETVSVTLGCLPVAAIPLTTETITWHDATGGTSTVDWATNNAVGQTVAYTGTVTAGRHAGDTATKITSGTSYLGSIVGCLLGTPIASTTGLVDSLLFTH